MYPPAASNAIIVIGLMPVLVATPTCSATCCGIMMLFFLFPSRVAIIVLVVADAEVLVPSLAVNVYLNAPLPTGPVYICVHKLLLSVIDTLVPAPIGSSPRKVNVHVTVWLPATVALKFKLPSSSVVPSGAFRTGTVGTVLSNTMLPTVAES